MFLSVLQKIGFEIHVEITENIAARISEGYKRVPFGIIYILKQKYLGIYKIYFAKPCCRRRYT